MRWAGHVVCMGERKDEYRVLARNLREINNLDDQGLEGTIILKWIFKKQN
jgi:hypothetical protein